MDDVDPEDVRASDSFLDLVEGRVPARGIRSTDFCEKSGRNQKKIKLHEQRSEETKGLLQRRTSGRKNGEAVQILAIKNLWWTFSY